MRRVLFFLSLVAGLSAQVVFPPPTNQISIVYGNNQETLPNAQFLQPMTVQVLSPSGNPVAGAVVTFTLPQPLATGVAGANFSGNAPTYVFTATATTNAQGYASSPKMTADSPVGSFVATVASSGLPSIQFKLKTTLLPQPGPPIALPNWLSFSMVTGGNAPPAQNVAVITAPVNFYTVAADVPWIKLAPRAFNSLDVSVDPTGMAFGHYEGIVMLSRDTPVKVGFDIFDKPTINANCDTVPTSALLASPCKTNTLQFNYSQGANGVPLQQRVTIGSAVRLVDVAVDPIYVSPKTGNWLGVASRRGVTLPITLTVVVDPRGLDPGTYTGAIQIASPDARNSPFLVNVTLTVTGYKPPTSTRAPFITSFASAASGSDGFASAGQLVRLAGGNLSCLAAPSVQVDGQDARVLSAGDREISLVVPELSGARDRVPVRVTCGEATSDEFVVPAAYAAPELFAAGEAQALGYNDNLTLNSAETPAVRGSVVTLFGTGFGSIDEADHSFVAPVSVTVGGQIAEVLSAARVKDMPGVVQLRVRIPEYSSTGTVPFEVQSGVQKSQTARTIEIK